MRPKSYLVERSQGGVGGAHEDGILVIAVENWALILSRSTTPSELKFVSTA